MTKEYLTQDGRFELPSVINQELEQLARLLPHNLPDSELAHRMAISVKEVRRMKKMIGDKK